MDLALIFLLLTGVFGLLGILIIIIAVLTSRPPAGGLTGTQVTMLPPSASSNTLSVYPYAIAFRDQGLLLAYIGTNASETLTITNKELVTRNVEETHMVQTIKWLNKAHKSLTVPLAQGAPYITLEIQDMSLTLESNSPYVLEAYQNNMVYIIRSNQNRGYVLFLTTPLVITASNHIVEIPPFTGTLRVAYFNSEVLLDVLAEYAHTYPVSARFSDMNLIWTTKNLSDTPVKLLMLALPNLTYEGTELNHPDLAPLHYSVLS